VCVDRGFNFFFKKKHTLLAGILYRATALRMLRQGKAGERGLLQAGEGGKVVGAAEEALALTVSFLFLFFLFFSSCGGSS
jgi:hypothetical protein